MQNSIISFPSRGHWGSSSWRGNTSGHVMKALFEQVKPKTVVDCMVGSGTTTDVAKEMGIVCVGLDLHQGFNAVRDDILDKVGYASDLTFCHPPYAGCIKYSGEVWGTQPDPNDLSHCSLSEFNERMQLVMLNLRRATVAGGYYSTLIGDWRHKGVYTSLQAELITRLPSDELAAVIIKQQHQCVSDSRSYTNFSLPRINHEFLLLWRKKAAPVLVFFEALLREQTQRVQGTWRNMVTMVLRALGGKSTLERIYNAIAREAPEKLASNDNWKAKVRQVLNQHPSMFTSEQRGVWALAQ